MKQKLLLFFMMVSFGMMYAQDTIRTLVITEAKMDRAEQSYVEITNMGDVALNLSDFEFGMLTPWNNPPDPGWPEGPQVDNQSIERLPDIVLAPGESYLIGAVGDYTEEAYARDVAKFGYSQDWAQRFLTKPEMWELIDLPVHISESPTGDPTDSISSSDIPRLNYPNAMTTWGGRDVFYLRHHISPTDSAIIDQVGGLFTDENGSNPDGGMVDVAGVEGATGNHYLIRRFDVKKGNTTFVTGIDLADSEWIPIPFLSDDQYNERQRAAFWTIGNHVNAVLDETTLTSSTIEIDWNLNTISVPWGVRNDDSIMYQFDYTPGFAWHYDYAPVHEDSAYVSVRSGDILTIFACGNTLQTEAFTIQVMDATADANIVIPMREMTEEGDYDGAGVPYEVTDAVPGMDTISEIPFACRVDSLFKYLEKAPNASWEFVWVDGNERTDLKNGDILRVTAEDGSSVKDYYLKLQRYRKSRNSDLSSITWPDIPEIYKGIYGWLGDTIPSFASAVENYVVQVPADVDGIPALVGKADDTNASVAVQRAVNLFGSVADKTVTFTVTAENDTTITEYTVQLEKEKMPAHVQPWNGEPFFSQIVWQDQWANAFMEIVNPGTDAIDMSNYMIYFGDVDNWADAITGSSGVDDFDNRYHKYIPGRIWPDTSVWAADPGKCIQDLNVATNVFPGDVFVLGDIISTGQAYGGGGFGEGNWPAENQSDVHFSKNCPWDSPPNNWTALQQWNTHYFLFKIIGEGGDSVRNGEKAANDPNDFLLLDTWGGEGTGLTHVVGGEEMQQTTGYTRKAEHYIGTPTLGESFGTDAETSHWIKVDRPWFNSIGVGWPMDILRITDGIGSHFMNDVSIYRSTVASLVYKVSGGYSMDEEIRGATTGTTVDQFIANLIKADEGQSLTVKSGGAEITADVVLTHGDSLVVLSADVSNTTRYFIEITDEGLSDDAVLTSTEYTVATDPPSVSGFEIETLLKDVVEGVTVPAGAMMNVIDANDASVPLVTINFDTLYVNVLATDQVYFEVIAEDGATKIVYQLMPDSDPSDAYVTSSVFEVDQDALLIKLIPQGTTVKAMLDNLVPATGATWVLLDKLGYERTGGLVVLDDRLVVTAEDGETTKTYFLSLLEEIANYLAYVISDVYLIDQEALTISGVVGTESVTDFSANVTPAEAATMEVQDATGAAKADTDMMAKDDLVQVTAGNGVNVVYYTVELDYTGINDLTNDDIRIYPNPSTGQLNIAGAEMGSRIRVYNSIGVAVREVVVFSGIETLSLDDQPGGMFFITISNGDEVIGRYKVIKQ
ncbi:MAG: T9SS type A sorting domain-containing protein [Bacteroidales bacterium]|nr:T9SS type A sorting domain-containing protein [Bacteroidales bacterium]